MLLFSLQRLEKLQTPQYFLLRIVTDRTRIDKNSISILNVIRHFIASHLHNRCDNFTISYIHLATIRFDK